MSLRRLSCLALIAAACHAWPWADVTQGSYLPTGSARPQRVSVQQPAGRTYWSRTVRSKVDTSQWRIGRNRVFISRAAGLPAYRDYYVRPFTARPQLSQGGVWLEWPDLGRTAYYVTAHDSLGRQLMADWVYHHGAAVPSVEQGRTIYRVATPTGISATTWIDRTDYATERVVEPYFPINDTTKRTVAFSWDDDPQDGAYYLQVYDAGNDRAVWQGYVYDTVQPLDLPRGEYRWRVTPVSVLDVQGQPSPWRTFRSVDAIQGMENLLGQNPLATTTADRAGLLYPEDAIRMPNGDLLIADTLRHVLKRVANGVVTVVAGTGVAGYSGDGAALEVQFDRPAGLLLAPDGRVLVADMGNFLLREYDPASGSVRTLAGVPRQQGRCREDGQMESNALGYVKHMGWRNGELVVAMAGLYRWPGNRGDSVRGHLYVFRGGRFEVVPQTAGLAISQLLGFDWRDNDLWFVYKDLRGFHRLGKLSPLGVQTVEVDAGAYAQGVIATGPDTALIGRHTSLARYEAGRLDTVAYGFANITMMRRDGTSLLVTDSDALRVDAVDPVSGAIATLVENGRNTFAAPISVARRSATEVVLLTNQPSGIFSHDLETGATRRIAGTGSVEFATAGVDAKLSAMRYPTHLAILSDGRILYVEQHGIWEVDPVTRVQRIFAGAPSVEGWADGLAAGARFRNVKSVRETASGDLLVADAGNGFVRRLHTKTGRVLTIAGDGTAGAGNTTLWYGRPARSVGLNYPTDALPADGGYYLTQAYRNVVSFVGGDGNLVPWAGVDLQSNYQGTGRFSDGPRLSASFSTPLHLEWLAPGTLLVTDQFNHMVRIVGDTTQTVLGTGAQGFGPNLLNMPASAISVGSRVLVCDTGNGLVRFGP